MGIFPINPYAGVLILFHNPLKNPPTFYQKPYFGFYAIPPSLIGFVSLKLYSLNLLLCKSCKLYDVSLTI